MDIHSLRRVQRLLRERESQTIAEIAALERKKSDLFHQGVRQPAARLQRVVARQIVLLEGQAALLERTLALLQKQSLLLAHLIYARENADRLEELAGIDWNSLFAAAARSAAARDMATARLDRLLAVLARPAASVRLPPPGPAEEIALVAQVPDGDGLELADGRRVRYIGIDAPEIAGYDGRPEGWAEEARDLNRALVLGRRVRLVRDTSESDRYGRLLRYVYVGKRMVNAELLRAGLATVLEVPPDLAHAATFRRLEEAARRQKRGMWE